MTESEQIMSGDNMAGGGSAPARSGISPLTTDYQGKVPPHSLELEMNILGGVMIDNSLLDVVVSRHLKPDHFYKSVNSLIFKAMVEMHNSQKPIDSLTLTEELKLRGQLDAIGGPYYLTELTTSFASSESIEYSAVKVMEYWMLRDTIRLSSGVRDKCYQPGAELSEVMGEMQNHIIQLSDTAFKKRYQTLRSSLGQTMEEISEISKKDTHVIGVPSGYEMLDKLTGGFQKSELIIIAGRPSHGKTALALSIARNCGVDYRLPIGIFSIEMSNRELCIRLAAQEAGVDIQNFKSGRLSKEDWEQVNAAVLSLNDGAQMVIDDSSGLTVTELQAKARRMKTEYDVSMIIVDYLQLMEAVSKRGNDTRDIEIGGITRGLKALSKDLDIPVVVLSQLSRKIEDRGEKHWHPQLSDLRESGNIENDADVVIFVWRPEVNMSKDDPKFFENQGIAKVIIGKQRNGPVGEFTLTFIHKCARFENYTPKRAEYNKASPQPFGSAQGEGRDYTMPEEGVPF